MIYTFYSFKGGVGRSMALAAVAYIFAQRGLKVLTIDFDLEAPGLERYFVPPRQAAQARAAPGLIDLLSDYKAAMTSEAEFEKGRFRRWWDYVIEAVPNAKGGGYVDLMTAGMREPEERLQAYASAVRSFDWMNFFHNWHGEQFFAWLRQQLLGQGDEPARGYDVVLVDSRTGLTEMGGVCAYQLADCAVMFCAANQQNIDGTLQVARDFQSDAVRALRGGRELDLLVLPARLEPDNQRREEFLRGFELAFPRSQFLPKALYEAGQDYRTLALPYVREFAVIERLVGDDDPELGVPSEVAEATFARLADALTLIARDGRLVEQHDSALAALAPSMAGSRTPTVTRVAQITDPTRRSSGFDLLLDLSALKDRDQRQAIEQSLKAAGLHASIDHEQTQSGGLWSESRRMAIAQSEAVAIFVGDEHTSVGVAELLAATRAAGKPILPLVDGSVPSRALPPVLAVFGLSGSRYLTLDPARPDDCAQQIKSALGSMRRSAASPSSQIVMRDPYPGERAFTEDDAEFFFGREREVGDLLLLARASGITVLVGAAGVGKTSLLRAGLIPRLRKEPGPSRLHYVDLAAGAAPDSEKALLVEGDAPASETWLLLDGVDSFPDGGGERAIQVRINELAGWLALAERPGTRVVLAIRDTLPAPLRSEAFARWNLQLPGNEASDPQGPRRGTVFNLAPMSAAGLQAAIEKPAARVGHVLDPGLPQLLIDQAGAAYGAIAQIARVLPRLWTERTRGWLTLRAHDAAGGVRGCFEASFQNWLAGLEGERRLAAESLVQTLSHLDAGAQLAAEPATWAPLPTIPVLAQADPLWLREQMAAHRLIELWRAAAEVAGTPSDGDVRVCLLFGTPKAYGAPFDKPLQPDFMLWRRRFASYVSSWESAGHAPMAVIAGPQLAEARQYRSEHGDRLTDAERALIDASLAAEQEAAERERRLDAERLAAEGLRQAKDAAEHERDLALAAKQEAEAQRAKARKAQRRSLWLAILCLLAFIATVALNINLNTEKRRSSLAATGGFVAAYAATDPTAAALAAVEVLQDPATPPSAQWQRARVLDSSLALAELHGHQDSVTHAAFSPDGQTVVTASDDRTARLWSRDGKPLAELRGHGYKVIHAEFSPDGQTVVTASDDSTARLWSREGEPLGELRGHKSWLTHAEFSPDGNTVLTASYDHTARLWSREGKLLAELRGHQESVWHAEFSPDGQTVVTASGDNTARLWSRDGKPLAELRGHQGGLWHAEFSPDGQTVATASGDATARLWSRDGKPLAELRGHQGAVEHAAFSPDGQTVLTASEDGTARLWSREGKPLAELRGHKSWVTHAAFSPDGQTVLTASGDRTARLWSLEGKLLAELRGHQDSVNHAEFSPDGQTVLTASGDGSARLWNRDVKPFAELRGHKSWLTHAEFSPGGQTVVTASDDGTARLWTREGKPVAELRGHKGEVNHAEFSPDGQTVVTASDDGTARLWTREGKPVAELRGHKGEVNHAEFSPNGQTVVTASDDGTARLWTREGKPVAELRGHKDEVNHAEFSPDGQTVVTASDDGTARLWSREGKLLAELRGHQGAVLHAAFSPDGKTVVTASDEGTARLWSRDGKPLAELSGHRNLMEHADFSPDGQTVVTASYDNTARLWSREGKPLAELRGHQGAVEHAAFSPDGQTVLTASGDRTARLWSLEGKLLAELRGHQDSVNHAEFSPDGQTVVTASNDGTARLWPIGKEAFIARIKQIAKPCLTVDERRRFFVDEDEETLRQRVEACEQAHQK